MLFVQEQAAERGAALTCGAQCAEDGGAEGEVQIRVGHDDQSVVAA